MVLPFKLTPPRIVALVAASLVLLWCIGSVVSLLGSRAQLERAWDVVARHETARAALLQEFEGVVQGVAAFQPALFQAVQVAQVSWNDAVTLTEQVAAIHALDDAEAQLRTALAQYPQLPNMPTYRDLQTRLTTMHAEADAARASYDQTVQLFNVRLLVFPRNIIAAVFGLEPAPRFQFAESQPAS